MLGGGSGCASASELNATRHFREGVCSALRNVSATARGCSVGRLTDDMSWSSSSSSSPRRQRQRLLQGQGVTGPALSGASFGASRNLVIARWTLDYPSAAAQSAAASGELATALSGDSFMASLMSALRGSMPQCDSRSSSSSSSGWGMCHVTDLSYALDQSSSSSSGSSSGDSGSDGDTTGTGS